MNLHIYHNGAFSSSRIIEHSRALQCLRQRKIPWGGNGRPKFVALRDKMVTLDGISLALSGCGMVKSGMQPTQHRRGPPAAAETLSA